MPSTAGGFGIAVVNTVRWKADDGRLLTPSRPNDVESLSHAYTVARFFIVATAL